MKAWLERHPALTSILLISLLTLPWLGGRGMQNPDETRYGAIPLEMLARGDFILPYLNGVPYFEKPPLVYWLGIVSGSMFGTAEWAFRLWPFLSAILLAVVTVRLARHLFGAVAALNAGLVVAASIFITLYAQLLSLDLVVAALMSVALTAFLHAATGAQAGRGRSYWLLHLACALAVLAKGLIGVVLPGLVIFVWCVMTRRWDVMRACFWPPGIALFLLVAVPWHVWAELRQPGFAKFYFIHEHFQRFTSTIHRRDQGLWFLPVVLLVGLLPWTGFLPAALHRAWTSWRSRAATAQAELFLLLWAVLIFGFFMTSRSQLPGYLLPIVPPLAILIGRLLTEQGRPASSRVAVGFGAIIFIACAAFFSPLSPQEIIADAFLSGTLCLSLLMMVAALLVSLRHPIWKPAVITAGMIQLVFALNLFGYVQQPKSLRDLLLPYAETIRGHDLVSYRTYRLDGTFYLRKPTVMIDAGQELEYGLRLTPRPDLFHGHTDVFQKRFATDIPVFVLLRERHLDDLPDAVELGRRDGMVLVTNRAGAAIARRAGN